MMTIKKQNVSQISSILSDVAEVLRLISPEELSKNKKLKTRTKWLSVILGTFSPGDDVWGKRSKDQKMLGGAS